MSTNGHFPLAPFHVMERVSPSVPAVADVESSVVEALAALSLPAGSLVGKRIAVSVGSRGIASLAELVRAACGWLKAQGAKPFVFPGMGSHGGATAEGQRRILAEYGVTEKSVGVEIRSSMESVMAGTSTDGIPAYMDRNAWESDGVLVFNRIKPHTDFCGSIESGLLKMMSVGMGKVEGASQTHRAGWKHGFEHTIRTMAGAVLSSGKILAGLAAVENEMHEVCQIRAARPEGIVAMEQQLLLMARPLVPRIPFPRLQILIVDEMGKNISGAGMDTKTIGRGVELQPGESPEISMIYVRDVTPESEGNAVGVGFADLIHEKLFRKIDFNKMYINARTSLNPAAARLPLYSPTDRAALDVALGHVGSPEPELQRVVWIRNTQALGRMAVSSALAEEAKELAGWRISSTAVAPSFDPAGDLNSPF